MANCGQSCPYNTLDGCKVKEYNAICPLTNMATPVTEYRMTNADRIRAMSDEELANMLTDFSNNGGWVTETGREIRYERHIEWLKQPAEVDNG